jgi:hypothetical protein
MLFVAVHESAVDAVDGSSTGTSVPWMWGLLRLPRFRGAMQTITTIGLDIAKSFQVHGVDAAGQVVVRRQLKRRYVLAFFLEACASSHHLSRELQTLGPTAYPNRRRPSIGTTEPIAPPTAMAVMNWMFIDCFPEK